MKDFLLNRFKLHLSASSTWFQCTSDTTDHFYLTSAEAFDFKLKLISRDFYLSSPDCSYCKSNMLLCTSAARMSFLDPSSAAVSNVKPIKTNLWFGRRLSIIHLNSWTVANLYETPYNIKSNVSKVSFWNYQLIIKYHVFMLVHNDTSMLLIQTFSKVTVKTSMSSWLKWPHRFVVIVSVHTVSIFIPHSLRISTEWYDSLPHAWAEH